MAQGIGTAPVATPANLTHSTPDAPYTATAVEFGWVSSPDGRGTYDILLSCFATLFLCAWTAYHPNVDITGSFWKKSKHRIKWLILATLAPEVVLYCAWSQWTAARKLRKEINYHLARANSSADVAPCDHCTHPQKLGALAKKYQPPAWKPDPIQKPQDSYHPKSSLPIKVASVQGVRETDLRSPNKEWSLAQAFFAVSGGFKVESSSFLRQRHLVFTPSGLVQLARAELLPTINEEEVKARSKADNITKVIVCLQVVWFWVQSMARLVQGLPITLLELHALTHTICALLMYFLWFKKPCNVDSGVLCEREEVVDMAALFASACDWGFDAFENWDRTLHLCTMRHVFDPKYFLSGRATAVGDALPLAQIHKCMTFLNAMEDLRRQCISHHGGKLQEQIIRAGRAIQRLREKAVHLPFEQVLGASPPAIRFAGGQKLVTSEQSDVWVQGDLDRVKRHPSQQSSPSRFVRHRKSFGAWVICIAYGGAHLSAWAYPFPTTIEMWLWRASGIALASYGLVIAILEALETLFFKSHRFNKGKPFLTLLRFRDTNIFGFWVIKNVTGPIYVLLFTFILCRLYLLAETLADLRAPPAGTYDTVNWPRWIPHAGS